MKKLDVTIGPISSRFKKLEFALDERMRRLYAAAEVSALGHGGITIVAKATGISRRAIHQGLVELEAAQTKPIDQKQRIRKAGGGRKPLIETEAGVLKALEKLVEPTTRGDSESPLRWTCKSLRTLSEELRKQGYTVSYPKVGDLLRMLGYSLQANRKVLEGTDHPDRNAQFEFINEQVSQCIAASDPVISVDTKKKELVGAYKNQGTTWRTCWRTGTGQCS